jgi:hypothetical protein
MIEQALTRLSSIPADKVLHFAAGVVLFAVALPFTGSTYALVVAVVAGFVKELYDALNKENHTPTSGTLWSHRLVAIWDSSALTFKERSQC